MDQKQPIRNINSLFTMILVAVIYGILTKLSRTLTGNQTLDGIIGVILGLFICSFPAANLVDMIFFRHWALLNSGHKFANFGWLMLNAIVILAGWLVIVSGTLHFAVHLS
jgi:hypothetical protein